MAIHVLIQPDGVHTVTIAGNTRVEEDRCILAWPLIRDRLKAIDRLLVRATRDPVERNSRERGRR